MANLVPIPEDLPISAAVDALTAGSAMSGTGAGPRTSPIIRYFSAIRRVKWLVLLLTLAGLGGGVVVSRLRPQSYDVAGGLQLSPDESSPLIGLQYQTLIQQYHMIEPIIRERRLFIRGPKRTGGPPLPPGPSGPNKALFNGFTLDSLRAPIPGEYRLKISSDRKTWDLTNTATAVAQHGVVGDSVGLLFGFHWLPVLEPRWAGETFDFTVYTVREAADDLRKHLDTKLLPPQAPRFISLTLNGQDPEGTAGALNDLMDRFVRETSKYKRQRLATERRAYDSMLGAARAKLTDDERLLASYKVKTITLPRDQLPVAPGLAQTQPMAYESYLAQRGNLDALRRDRRDLTSALGKLQSGDPAIDLFVAIPSVKNSLELMSYLAELNSQESNLKQNRRIYGDSLITPDGKINMRELNKRVNDLKTVIVPQYTRVVLQRLDSLIARTDAEVLSAKTDLLEIPQRTIDENALTRERAQSERIVSDLTTQSYSARSKEAGASIDLAVTEMGVAPLVPNKNRTNFIIAFGTLIGLAAGLGLALLLDITDKRLRYADQVTTGLGLTILGVVPEIRRTKGKQPTVEEAAQVIEAFRTIRLNLAHTIGQGKVVLTISSPSPGDGKSLVASNLALSFAESGYRTLLIDGDSRRGELHRTFGTDRRPGLLDYLVGELSLDNLLRDTTHGQLSLITGGSRRRNAPELLGTSRMRELIAKMRDKFDVVLVDSPPMGAGIDPFVLATLTGNLMLVLRAGATEKDLAEAKLQIVDQLPIRLVGAVLNDVRTTMNDYKYYSYTYGYGAVDEPKQITTVSTKVGS